MRNQGVTRQEKEALLKPQHWEVYPEKHYGKDSQGNDYYLVNGDVFKTNGHATRWFSTQAGFEAFIDLHIQ